MSIEIMSRVWDQSSQEGSSLLLLLALADHASDDGVCWPGIARLAHKTRKTERHTKRLLVKLEESGEVYIARETGRGNTNMYYVTLGFSEEEMIHTLIKRFELDPVKAVQIAKQVIQLQEKGDDQDTFSDGEKDEKGDTQGQEKVTPRAEKVTPRVTKGDTVMSPESLLTVTKSSRKPSSSAQGAKKKPPTKQKSSALLPDTLQARKMFGRLRANAKAQGRRGPKQFPTLECKQEFDQATAKLGDEEFEKALVKALQQGINSVTRITSYISAWANNGGRQKQKGGPRETRQRSRRGSIAEGAVQRQVATEEEARAILGDDYFT